MIYKKPVIWLVALSIIVCMIVAFCFLTDPEAEDESGNYGIAEQTESTNPIVSTNMEATAELMSLQEVMDRILGTYDLNKALPYEEPLTSLTEDALVLLCQSENKKYTAYGFVSPEYGLQGIMIDYIIDGESNWNYFYETWAYGSSKPTFKEQGENNVTFTFMREDGRKYEMDFETFATGTMEKID